MPGRVSLQVAGAVIAACEVVVQDAVHPALVFQAQFHKRDGGRVDAGVASSVLAGGWRGVDDGVDFLAEALDAAPLGAFVGGINNGELLGPITEGIGMGHAFLPGDGGEVFAGGDAIANLEREETRFCVGEIVADVAGCFFEFRY